MTTEADPTLSGTGTPRPWLSAEAIELYRRIVLDPGILGADTTRGRGDETTMAITQLAETGLARPVPGTGWEAVHPGLAVDTLANRVQHVLAEHLLQISVLGQNFTMLHGAYAKCESGSIALFEPVANKHEARGFLAEHLGASTDDVFACSGGPGTRFTDCEIDTVLRPGLVPVGRRLHLVIPNGSTLHSQFAEGRATRIRACRQVPLTAVCAGPSAGALVLPASTPPSSTPRFFVYQHPAAHALVKTLLDSLWSFSAPLRTQALPPAGIDRAIVGLLAIGKKDENIARQLGLGLRTTRKHIADIFNALGARSRFEAGVLAERNGWLDPRPVPLAEPAEPSS